MVNVLAIDIFHLYNVIHVFLGPKLLMSKLKRLVVVAAPLVLIGLFYGANPSIDASYVGGSGGCTKDHPILVTVTNRSPMRIDQYNFKLSATINGYSSIIASYLYGSDKIIPAFSSQQSCWAVPYQGGGITEYLNSGFNISYDDASKIANEKWEKDIPSLNWSVTLQSTR